MTEHLDTSTPKLRPIHRNLDSSHADPRMRFEDHPIVWLDGSARAESLASLLLARLERLSTFSVLLTEHNDESTVEAAGLTLEAIGELRTITEALADSLVRKRKEASHD